MLILFYYKGKLDLTKDKLLAVRRYKAAETSNLKELCLMRQVLYSDIIILPLQ